jgi:endonuclease I
MRFFLVVAVFFFGFNLYPQTPENYYAPAYGKKGAELRLALNKIISNHKPYPYTAKTTDVWAIAKETEKDSLNPENIILIYTGASVNAAQEYNRGAGWTREHTWPKSRGDFGTKPYAGTDMHHITAETMRANATRNNRHFDWCKVCIPLMHNGDTTGSYYDEVSYSFLPRAAVRGDIARMMFYMVVRYEGEHNDPNLNLVEDYQNLPQTIKEPLLGNLKTLLQWHYQDSLSDYELRRNEVIFKYQNNRNPFIDHPDLVDYIFGSKQDSVWYPFINP